MERTTKEETKVTLKVSRDTNPQKLKTPIIQFLQEEKIVHLECIGMPANYNATRAIILSRGLLLSLGHDIKCIPIYQKYEIDDEKDKERTGIRWVLTLE